MGTVRRPARVQLFCALLLAPSTSLTEVEAMLQPHFGPIVLRSQALPFTQSTYYRREMGVDLTRLYVAFAPLIRMAELATIKHTTNALETMSADSLGQRRVNLDPGYLDLAKVVLATTKDYAHRLYIGGGLFAEVTLQYHQHGFQPWPWTYPDYCVPTTLTFFNQLRERYKVHLRHPSPAPPSTGLHRSDALP